MSELRRGLPRPSFSARFRGSWSSIAIWLGLVAACAAPMALEVVRRSPELGAAIAAGVGIAGWTWALVTLERREIRRGRRAATRRLRFVTAAFALVQAVVFAFAPHVVGIFYFPATLLVSVLASVLPSGAFGFTLAMMVAGGAQVLALVVLPGLGWVRFGGTTEFQQPRAPTRTFPR